MLDLATASKDELILAYLEKPSAHIIHEMFKRVRYRMETTCAENGLTVAQFIAGEPDRFWDGIEIFILSLVQVVARKC